MTKLIKAAASGDLDAVKKCLAQGEDVNQADERGLTPLIAASHLNHPKIVYHLLTLDGVDVDAKTTEGGYSALGWACYNHDTSEEGCDFSKVIDLLLKHDADVNAKDGWGNFPLSSAIEHQEAGLVKQLLGSGSVDLTLNVKDTGLTPLEFAKSKGFLEIADLISEHVSRPSLK